MSSANDEPEAELSDGQSEGGSPSKKKLILIIAVVVVLVIAGVGAYLAGLVGGGSADKEAEDVRTEAAADPSNPAAPAEAGADTAAPAAEPVIPVVYHDLPDFVVNLNSGEGRRSSFMKVHVSLEIADQESLKIVQAYEPRIVDSFQTYLRELKPDDLRGSAGIFRLREELLFRINKIVHPAKVNDILFKEMIVQ